MASTPMTVRRLPPALTVGRFHRRNANVMLFPDNETQPLAASLYTTIIRPNGLSRKSMLGKMTGREVHERVHASVAAALLAAERGADLLRVHDVAATRDALKLLTAMRAVQ